MTQPRYDYQYRTIRHSPRCVSISGSITPSHTEIVLSCAFSIRQCRIIPLIFNAVVQPLLWIYRGTIWVFFLARKLAVWHAQ